MADQFLAQLWYSTTKLALSSSSTSAKTTSELSANESRTSTASLPDDRSTMIRRKALGMTELDRSTRGDEDNRYHREPTVIKRDSQLSEATDQDVTESSHDEDLMHTSKMNTSAHEPLVVPSGGPPDKDSPRSELKTFDFLNSPSAWKSISSCLLYSFCSVSMILTNKSLASSYNHLIDGNLNVLLVVFQAVAAVVLVEACRLGKLVEYPPLNTSTLRAWAPVNVFFCLMLFTGMASLQTNSVPMVTVFKNVANLCTASGDYVLYGNRPENLALAAFGIMLAGAVFAAYNDLSMTFTGLFWMIANCLSTSGYVLYMKYATQTIKMNKFGMVFVNNVLCVLFLLPVATITGEVSILLRSPSIHTWDYFFKNMFAGFVGFFLIFASLNCVAAAGATTYAIVGSLNKVPVAVLGFVFFRSPMTQQTAFFIAVSLCGGFLYSYAKILTARSQSK